MIPLIKDGPMLKPSQELKAREFWIYCFYKILDWGWRSREKSQGNVRDYLLLTVILLAGKTPVQGQQSTKYQELLTFKYNHHSHQHIYQVKIILTTGTTLNERSGPVTRSLFTLAWMAASGEVFASETFHILLLPLIFVTTTPGTRARCSLAAATTAGWCQATWAACQDQAAPSRGARSTSTSISTWI